LLSLSPQVKAVILEHLNNKLREVATNLGFKWDADV
jgi:hypothetical protein